MKHMLIADDNEQIVEVLRQYAIKEGYEVEAAGDGQEAIRKARNREYDIVLLDVMMPELDGFTVCRKIRENSMVPVIMITAKGEDYDRIMGLDNGADDYIVKPFSPSEVMARVRAIMRRVEPKSSEKELTVGELRVNMERYQVYVRDEQAALTKKEVEILWLLMSNKGLVFSRNQILDAVWGYDYYGDMRTVDTHIKRLRAKLEGYAPKGVVIQTVRGVGYKLEAANE